MVPAPPSTPLSFTIHESLTTAYNVTVSSYLSSHNAHVLVVAAAVFHPASISGAAATPRILLIQRASGDAFPDRWEIPGGGADHVDDHVPAAGARELWEETGLRASAVTAVTGTHGWEEHLEGGGDVENGPTAAAAAAGPAARVTRWAKVTFLYECEADADGQVSVVLDPDEHRAYVWATEDEVRADRCGDVVLDWTFESQKINVLEAFGALKVRLPLLGR